MTAVATRQPVTKARPPAVGSPLESVVARISSARELIGTAYDAAGRGNHLDVILAGLDEELLPDALAALYFEPVSKLDIEQVHRKLFFPLSVLHAAWSLSKGLVLESTLQQAFEVLDRAHSDMDSASVQQWPIPDRSPASAPEGASKCEPADWSQLDEASGDLGSAEVLLGLLCQETAFNFHNAVASEMAQERISVLSDAIRVRLIDASELVDKVRDELMRAS